MDPDDAVVADAPAVEAGHPGGALAGEQLLAVVDRAAVRLPDVPRLAVLDAVDAEWTRWLADAQPVLAPLVLPAALWRLRFGADVDVDGR